MRKRISKPLGYRTLLILLAGMIIVYSHWIEPAWIQVTRHTLEAEVEEPMKIAHLSDLHMRKTGRREARLLELVKEERPDVILISGDSITSAESYTELGSFLKQLTAPLGVWLVRGNWEHWHPSPHELNIYRDAGVRFLNNTNAALKDNVWVIGLDDSFAGRPDLKSALPGVPHEAFKIGLFHSPEYFAETRTAFNLVLAGHTHGGQIRFPFLPPLWLPEGSGPYIEGWYTGKDTSKMYVSRGIGNSVLDIRFFCRPELPLITLVPKR